MKYYYLLAAGQPNDRAVYYTGTESFYGGQFWGNIHEAKLFNNLEDIYNIIKNESIVRFIIVDIADVTVEKIQIGYKDFLNNARTSEYELMHNYNTVSYITTSR